MTREETKKAIELMQAYVDGAEIENKYIETNRWIKCLYPSWNWDQVDYRIKTHSQVEIGKWYHMNDGIVVLCDNDDCGDYFSDAFGKMFAKNDVLREVCVKSMD